MNTTGLEHFKKNITPKEAKELQLKLRDEVILKNEFNKIKIICGIDLSIIKEDKKLICGIVNYSYPELEIIEEVSRVSDETFPYIPGLLSFREGPAILETIKDLRQEPDILVFDGHGIAHPRGIGIASFIGVLLDKPAFGIAKKKLFGEYLEPANEAGKFSDLLHPVDKSIIGAVLRTKRNVKPVFVSAGHKITLEKAHLFVNEVRRKMLDSK